MKVLTSGTGLKNQLSSGELDRILFANTSVERLGPSRILETCRIDKGRYPESSTVLVSASSGWCDGKVARAEMDEGIGTGGPLRVGGEFLKARKRGRSRIQQPLNGSLSASAADENLGVVGFVCEIESWASFRLGGIAS